MLTIFVNYGAKVVNGEIYLELNHSCLSDDLIEDKSWLVSYAATVPHGSPSVGDYRRLTKSGVTFCSLGMIGTHHSRVAKIYQYFRTIPNIWRTVKGSRFCYIFTPGHVGLLATLCCLTLRRPYGLYLRGEWKIGTPKFMHPFHSYLFRRAAFVLCTGEGLAKKTLGLNPNCDSVVPMSPILTRQNGSWCRLFGANASRILFVGQVIRAKGVYELIDALAILKGKYAINAELSIVGAGADLTDLQHRVNAAGLAPQVRFLGVVKDPRALAEIYQAHDVFCLPSYHEGFPRVFYEAMVFSMPIVTTRVGQIDTVLSHGRDTLFVDVRNPLMLAESLGSVLQDAMLREHLGLEARATVDPFLRKWHLNSHGRQVVQRLKHLRIDLS